METSSTAANLNIIKKIRTMRKYPQVSGVTVERRLEQHGISTQTVYNDLHGFIRNQHIHQETYMEAYKGRTQPREDVLQIDSSQSSKKKET